jgi:hypothetical protein
MFCSHSFSWLWGCRLSHGPPLYWHGTYLCKFITFEWTYLFSVHIGLDIVYHGFRENTVTAAIWEAWYACSWHRICTCRWVSSCFLFSIINLYWTDHNLASQSLYFGAAVAQCGSKDPGLRGWTDHCVAYFNWGPTWSVQVRCKSQRLLTTNFF